MLVGKLALRFDKGQEPRAQDGNASPTGAYIQPIRLPAETSEPEAWELTPLWPIVSVSRLPKPDRSLR